MEQAAARTGKQSTWSDAELLQAVAWGDRGLPLRELYQRYARRIYGLGVQLLGDRGLAEELVQESFLRVWRNADRYDPDRGSAATFIFTIARRLAVDLWRRSSSRPAVGEVPEGERAAEDEAERIVLRLGIREAVETIPPLQREVLELSYRDQLKQGEIAERLGIPLGTVKTRCFHGLRSLKGALAERDIHG